MRVLSNTIKGRGVVCGLVVVCLFGSAAFGQPWDGNGVEGDPYLIYDACDMQAIGADANYWDAHFELMADIDLSGYMGTSFNIIGYDGDPSDRKPFKGVFDGNDRIIYNFTYDSNGVHRIGLFGYVSDPNAEIRDLRLVDPNVDGGTGKYVGPLVGHLVRGTVTDCSVDGGRVSGGRCVGGLAGLNFDRISDCNASVNLTGQQQVGGLVGGSEGVISNCRSSSIVTAVYGSGGLVGSNTGNIYDSNSTGSVDGGFYVGGLVGENYTTGTISNSYSAGSVSGSYYVGGLVGLNSGDISSCYSTNTVSGVWEEIGGLVGRNEEGEIWNCYSKGDISGFADVGGFLGRNYEGFVSNCYSTGSASAVHNTGGLVASDRGGTVINCFWDVNSSGLDTSDGGIGKTTSEMQTSSTFAGWSCAGVWTIDEGIDYPHLIWENKPGEMLSNIQWYGAGSGTEAEPYLIYTAEQFNCIGPRECDRDKHFKLMADIDLSGYTGTSFNIIGTYWEDPFTGVFDGNAHTISNFTYSSTGKSLIGIFGFVSDPNAQIKDLGLIDPNIDAGTGSYVGALVGFSYGANITTCWVKGGSVSGNYCIGGLAGVNGLIGAISNCYSESAISGNGEIGGLVGNNGDEIIHCYSVGSVSGSSDVGGLVGYDYNGSYAKCFWDSDVNPDVNGIGNTSDPNVIGETTANMQTESTFTDAGWDFVGEVINGPNDIWDICEGTNYPKLVWQIPIADFVCPDGVNFIDYAFFAEHWLQSIYGDCDGVELTVNWVDFALFAKYWMLTACGECGGADFTGDGNVDLADLAVFAEHWLETEYAEVDLTKDGQVGLDDLREFTENWLAGI